MLRTYPPFKTVESSAWRRLQLTRSQIEAVKFACRLNQFAAIAIVGISVGQLIWRFLPYAAVLGLLVAAIASYLIARKLYAKMLRLCENRALYAAEYRRDVGL